MIENSIPVANRDLCRTLYDLTGWADTGLWWQWGTRRKFVETHRVKGTPRHARNGDLEPVEELSTTAPDIVQRCNGRDWGEFHSAPAYHLGYLMAKLPPVVPAGPDEFGRLTVEFIGPVDGWVAGYTHGDHLPDGIGKTAEDAAAALCIEMAKAGLLAGVEVVHSDPWATIRVSVNGGPEVRIGDMTPEQVAEAHACMTEFGGLLGDLGNTMALEWMKGAGGGRLG